MHCLSFKSSASQKIWFSDSWSHTPAHNFCFSIYSRGIWSPSRICVATASDLHGATSASLWTLFFPICLVLSNPGKIPSLRYYLFCSLQKLILNFSSTAALLHKFDLLNFIRCVIQVPIKPYLIILSLNNKKPRLYPNQWLGSYWLDLCLLLEVSPTLYINTY